MAEAKTYNDLLKHMAEAMKIDLEVTAPQPRRITSLNRISTVSRHQSMLPMSQGALSRIPSAAGAVEKRPELPMHVIKLARAMGNGETFYCSACLTPLNSLDQITFHTRGKQHKRKSSTMPAECERYTRDLVKSSKMKTDFNELSITRPRTYQIELYRKAMRADTLCFLPTGTGKTLVSIMLMCKMLQLNPERQVVFLVDKVILLLQQSAYIQSELGWMKIGGSAIRIAVLCGEKVSGSGCPLSEEHVIVSTAAFYENCLSARSLRYTDVSLIIFDEAHHCVKAHPFNRILKLYHIPRDEDDRPRLLGLTASPAGKPTLGETLNMLRTLLINMGWAKIAKVVRHRNELALFAPDVRPKIIVTVLSGMDLDFGAVIIKHLKSQCMPVMSTLSPSIHARMIVAVASDNPMAALADVGTDIGRFELNYYSAGSFPEHRADLEHVQACVTSLYTMCVCGLDAAFECLKETLSAPAPGRITTGSLLRRLTPILQEFREFGDDAPTFGYEELVELILESVAETIRRERVLPYILVLVQRRHTVHTLYKKLSRDKKIDEAKLKTTWLLGHGDGTTSSDTSSQGMTVRQQTQHLKQIKEGTHRLIVATDVAGEGIDLPQCGLVVLMYPPTSVTTLVQFRGRARKRGGTFVALVTTEGQMLAVEKLMSDEKNMVEAVDTIYNQQNSVPQYYINL